MKIGHSQSIWFCRDELSLAILFWEDMIAFISMPEVLLFLLSIWTFILNHLDLNIHATIKRITLKIMLGSISHRKFFFYHLPTRGRAGIKLGDAWYVSKVSIIFDCSMLLYYPSRMFYMHLCISQFEQINQNENECISITVEARQSRDLVHDIYSK